MAREWKRGPMAQGMKASTNLEKNMERACFCSRTGALMMESSSRTTFKESALTVGPTGGNTSDSGLGIKCMGRGRSPGPMEGSMRGIIPMTRSTGMEYLSGMMVGSTRGSGRTGSSMEGGSTSWPMA